MAWISLWKRVFYLTVFGLLYPAISSGESSGHFTSTEEVPTEISITSKDQHWVEIENQSQKSCATGFYSVDNGTCLPCKCHGHSEQCLPNSGICIQCQNNTTGDHCEKCLDGYIGDVVQGHYKSCQPCPCPLSVPSYNFAVSCMIKNDKLRCMCKENYAGSKCERCAPGYYGSPLVQQNCKKCNCNGNSDPNLIFDDCDEITGHCRNCLKNTTGLHCEQCASGYYGDAIKAKNCTEKQHPSSGTPSTQDMLSPHCCHQGEGTAASGLSPPGSGRITASQPSDS